MAVSRICAAMTLCAMLMLAGAIPVYTSLGPYIVVLPLDELYEINRQKGIEQKEVLWIYMRAYDSKGRCPVSSSTGYMVNYDPSFDTRIKNALLVFSQGQGAVSVRYEEDQHGKTWTFELTGYTVWGCDRTELILTTDEGKRHLGWNGG